MTGLIAATNIGLSDSAAGAGFVLIYAISLKMAATDGVLKLYHTFYYG
jgi:hypothetical protein